MNSHLTFSKYQTEQGAGTTADDPKRLIWYGVCGMWTDNWHKVAGPGVPHCGGCGSPGFQITADEWLGEGLDKYDAEHPGYKQEFMAKREFCPKRQVAIQ